MEMELESDDEDDDSPYFVKITLDDQFLSHLQMPEITSGNEVEGKYDEIIQNEIFRQIIQREISMMFGIEMKPEEKLENNSRDSKRITIEKLEDDVLQNIATYNNNQDDVIKEDSKEEDDYLIVQSDTQMIRQSIDSQNSEFKHQALIAKIKDGTVFENDNSNTKETKQINPDLRKIKMTSES